MKCTISEAADLIGVHIETIRRWDREGKIKSSRTIGNHRRIDAEEISRIRGEKKENYSEKMRFRGNICGK